MSKKKPASGRKPRAPTGDRPKTNSAEAIDAAIERVSKADRHPVSFKLSDGVYSAVRADLEHVCRAAGMEVKMAAYAKSALMQHGALRECRDKVSELEKEINGRIAQLKAQRNRGAATELENIARRLGAILRGGF